MNLASTLVIYGGGPGSGCNPEVAEPGCGRPKKDGGKEVNYLENKLSDAKGSNPGGTYEGSDKVQRYVKFYTDDKQAYGEALANKLYRDLHVNAPESVLFKKDGKAAIGNKIVEGKLLSNTDISMERAQKFMKGFAADVLTANWDAVGMHKDNVLVDEKGDLHRLDQGGTFLKRAKMGDKPESALNNISEVTKFFTSTNPSYSYMAMMAGYKSPADFKSQFWGQVQDIEHLRAISGGWEKYVTKNVPELEGQAKQKIVDMLNERSHLLYKKAVALNEGKDEPEEAPKPVSTVKKYAVPAYEKPKEEQGLTPSGKPKGYWKKKSYSYSPNKVGGYFQKGGFTAKMYQELADKPGEWQSIKGLMEKHQAPSAHGALFAVKDVGKGTGKWVIERSKGSIRMIMTDPNAKTSALEETESKSVTSAADLVDKLEKLPSKTQYNSSLSPKAAELYNSYMKSLGVSDTAKNTAEYSIREWTGSVHNSAAQKMRKVAVEYYQRSVSDEHFDAYSNTMPKDTSSFQNAVMALKSIASAQAKRDGIEYVYRGIQGAPAEAIQKQLDSGKKTFEVPLNALSSWSESPGVANSFAGGVVLRMKVDPENIWASHKAMPWLFSAHNHESEYIVGVRSPNEKFDISDIGSVQYKDGKKYFKSKQKEQELYPPVKKDVNAAKKKHIESASPDDDEVNSNWLNYKIVNGKPVKRTKEN